MRVDVVADVLDTAGLDQNQDESVTRQCFMLSWVTINNMMMTTESNIQGSRHIFQSDFYSLFDAATPDP